MKPPFTIDFREITPAQAKQWLTENNPKNRAMRQDTVATLARDMLSDQWIPNHQGIAFGDSGALIDGQHRLAAIVKSGITLPMLVCEGVPEKPPGLLSTIGSIDRGMPRSVGDILRIEHNYKKHQAFAAAVVTSVVMLSLRDTRRVRKCSISQTLAVLELFPDDVRWIIEKRPQVTLFNSAGVLTPFAWARSIAPAVVESLLDKFIKGTSLVDGDPMLGLRNYIIASTGKNRTGSDPREARLRLMEVVLHCLWLGIHDQQMTTKMQGAAERETKTVTWFREKRRDFSNQLEKIFPPISGEKIVGAAKKVAPIAQPVPVAAPTAAAKPTSKPPPKPAAVAPPQSRGGVLIGGKSRKEVLREIAQRVG